MKRFMNAVLALETMMYLAAVLLFFQDDIKPVSFVLFTVSYIVFVIYYVVVDKDRRGS